jgi:long-chain acyl-CoA synthetase
MSFPVTQNLAQHLEENARRVPQKPALVYESLTYTYENLNRRINQAGNALLRSGVRKGARVIISLLNCPEFVISFYALAKIGAIAVPINYLLTKNEEKYVWEDSDAGLIITDGSKASEFRELTAGKSTLWVTNKKEIVGLSGVLDFWEKIENEPVSLAACPCTREDVVHILYTSGTTGKPKGAMLTHHSVMYCSSLYTDNDNMGEIFSPATKVVCALPLYHCYGQNVCLITPFSARGTVLLVDRFNTEKVLQVITDHRATMFAGVPTMYAYLSAGFQPGKHDLKSLEFCCSAGSALSAEIARAFLEKTGVEIIEGFGITEASAQAIAPPFKPEKRRRDKFGSIGIPLKNSRQATLARIVDEQGNDLPANAVGELVLQGEHVMKGYWRLPEETAKTIRDGWLHTGDLAKRDEDGYFYIVDRKKDMIIVGGENVYPREIEEVLYQNEKILEAAVVGHRDPVKGEVVKAVVVLNDGVAATEKELIDFCAQRLARFKVPKILVIQKDLPKSATGKILRRLVK